MLEALRVLLVEDSADDAQLLLYELQRSGYVLVSTRVFTPETMREALQHHPWDVIISDYVMPQFSGMAALRIMQQLQLDLPFIMVSGKAGEESAVEAIRAGAGDYILKGNLTRLVPAIEREIRDAAVRRDRRQTEEELRASEALFRATIASVADGLVISNPRGEIVFTNIAADRMFNYTAQEREEEAAVRWIARHATTADGKPLPVEDIPVIRALRGEVVQGKVLVIARPDGQAIWVSVSAAPIRTPDGTVTGSVVIYTDITALHELQDRQRVFLHMVSHDLRTPLTTIQGYAQLLEDTFEERQLDDGMHDDLQSIIRAAQRMNVMIEDLVDAARIEGGQLTLKVHAITLPDYLASLLKRMQAVFDLQRIELDIPRDLPAVCGDYNRLERIFTNLLSNALKYSDPGTPVVVRGERCNDHVRIAVIDHGQGIAPEDLPHLFERFYRAKTGRKAEGIGLGLYITRMLIEAHGGTIWIDSQPGQGSTFYFTLPVA